MGSWRGRESCLCSEEVLFALFWGELWQWSCPTSQPFSHCPKLRLSSRLAADPQGNVALSPTETVWRDPTVCVCVCACCQLPLLSWLSPFMCMFIYTYVIYWGFIHSLLPPRTSSFYHKLPTHSSSSHTVKENDTPPPATLMSSQKGSGKMSVLVLNFLRKVSEKRITVAC